jgi:hypothetical protein
LYSSTARTGEQNLPKLIVGTDFDQMFHCEIDEEMINEIEYLIKQKIIRFTARNCQFDEISQLMNKIAQQIVVNSVRNNF